MGPLRLGPWWNRHYRQVLVRQTKGNSASVPKFVQGLFSLCNRLRSLQPHGSPAVVRALKYVVQLAAVGAGYFLLARLGLKLAVLYPGAAFISLPAGFALAAVLLGGYRLVPAIFAAAY